MKKYLFKTIQTLLVFSLVFTLTNCGNLDNPLEELSGGGSGGSGSGSSVSVTSITVDLSKIDEKYLDTEKTKLQLTVGDEVTLSFTILPAEMASTKVELTAADATILSIDGLKVKALKEGETKVTAKAGEKTAECTVTVAKKAYSFKVTNLAGDDQTNAVTSLKMSNEDGTLVVEADVSGGKITIKAEKLSEITAAADFWFEAEIGGKPYIAKVNIDPTTLSPESDKTLAMATLGDVILSDGKFAARSSTGTNVAMIAYLGSSTGVDGYTHGLALALTDEASYMNWTTAIGATSGAAAHTPAAPTPMTSSWKLPSKDQWTNMIDACKNVLGTQNNYKDLRGGFGDITDASNLKSDGVYWSSTEGESEMLPDYPAWAFNFGDGIWYEYPQAFEYILVRACLAF